MLWNVQKNILQNMEISKISSRISPYVNCPKSSVLIAEKIRDAAKMCQTHNEYRIFRSVTEAFLGIEIKDIIKESVDFDERTDEYHFKG